MLRLEKEKIQSRIVIWGGIWEQDQEKEYTGKATKKKKYGEWGELGTRVRPICSYPY